MSVRKRRGRVTGRATARRRGQAEARKGRPDAQAQPAKEKKSRSAHVEAPVPLPAQVRDLDEPERDALAYLLGDYGVDPHGDWTRGREVKLVAREDLEPRRRVVLVQPGVLPVAAPFAPQTVGLPVASLARKGARLTMEGAIWIAPSAKRRVVVASEKGETLFLYGRSLLLRGVRRVLGEVRAGDEVVVVRGDGRSLGLGIAQAPLARGARDRDRDGDEVAVTNRSDLGRYLRDAQDVLE